MSFARKYAHCSCHVRHADSDTCSSRDLLHRHQHMVHERGKAGDTPYPVTSKPAGRTPIACSNCAKNKTKCDKKFPCTRCADRKLKCEMRPAQRPSKKVPRIQLIQAAHDDAYGGPENENAFDDDPGSQSNETSSEISTPAPRPMPIDTSGLEKTRRQSSSTAQVSASAFPRRTSMHDIQTPCQSPDNAFPLASPPATLESFLRESDSCEDGSSAMFDFDCGSLQRPMCNSFIPLCQPDLLLNAAPYSATSVPESITGAFVPDFVQSMHSISQLPMNDVSLQSLDYPLLPHQHDSTENILSEHRPESQSSWVSGISTDLDAVIVAHDAWPAFRCTATIQSSECPKTASSNLEKLEETLMNHDAWADWHPSWDEAGYALKDHLETVPFQQSPRDKLLAITQSFLHKALEIHADEQGVASGPRSARPHTSCIILPPSRVLDYCLQAYANSFERFYPLIPRRTLDPNLIMKSVHGRTSSLLLLLMIAQGASISPAIDGRWLVSGLTEACRISLFDIIEKNIKMSGDSTVLHSALLFTCQAGWSGDKWQMDIAMGQRGMYTSMLKHSGYFDASQRLSSSVPSDLESMWSDWIWHENRSR